MIKYSATFIKPDTYLDKDDDETVIEAEGWDGSLTMPGVKTRR